ncbi:MAG: VCBS repeat-containing protein [Deltaproteobacteria bacterium]|nr:VCBS repeat-containing protein [Deltaproteobacteria bacterium]
MRIVAPIVWLLSVLLLAACPSETPDPPVANDDDDDDATEVEEPLPSADTWDGWIPDRQCPEPLELVSEWPAAEALGLLHISVTGGSGNAAVWMESSPSGAIFDSAVGTYIAGETTGVTDVIRARDLDCFDDATLSINVHDPLEVRPTGGQVLPGDAFTFLVVGGSGETVFSPILLRSGGSLGAAGTYAAGPDEGIDETEAFDPQTGVTIPVTFDVASTAVLAPAPPHLVLPLGASIDVAIAGGSGWRDLTPDQSGLVTITGAPGPATVIADAPGRVELLVEDTYSSMSTTIVVDVTGTQTAPLLRGGHATFRGLALGPGDIDGDGYADALLGLMEANSGGNRSGAVYVYAGGPNGLEVAPAQVITWPEYYAEMAEDFVVEDIDGDGLLDLLVGVTRANTDRSAQALPPLEDTGAVAIYSGVPGGFFTSQPTSAIFGQYGSDHFGKSLTVCDINGDGDLDLAVGARYSEDRSNSPIVYTAGALHVFLGDGSGTFPELPDQSVFGVELDGSGNWIPDSGQELGYELEGGDIDGDGLCDLVAGSYNWSSGPGRSRDNIVTVWRGQADDANGAPSWGGLIPEPVLAIAPLAPENHNGFFGREVKVGDLDGDGLDEIVVGQYRYTEPTLSGVYHGAVRVYSGRALGTDPATAITPASTAVWTHSGTNSYDYAGAQVDITDVDGDGLLDLFVGDTREEGNGSPNDAGRLSVFLGQPNDLPETTSSWDFYADEGDARMGVALAGLGDVDGDGVSDVFGFASFQDAYGPNVGVPWYFSGLDPTAGTLLEYPGESAGQAFGEGARVVGDINSDGWNDALVGAWDSTSSTSKFKSGSAYLYLGGASGLPDVPDLELVDFPGLSGSDRLGWRVAPAGDFDGDGIDDFAVLARYDDKPNSFPSSFNDPGDCPSGNVYDVGSVYVFLGVPAGQPLPTEPAFVIYGPQASQRLDALDGGGDVNGDGQGDILISGYDWDRTGANGAGGFAVVLGRGWSGAGTDVICSYDAQLLGANTSYRMGRDITFIGDVDADGCDEFAVGAYLADWLFTNEGAVHVVKGWGGSGCPSEPTQAILSPGDSNDQAGLSLGAGGDIDGDGIPDLAVGAPYYYGNGYTRGSAWVVAGSWLTQVTYEPLDPAGTSITWPLWPVGDSDKEDWRVPGTDRDGRFGWDVTIVPNYTGGRAALAVGQPRGAGTGEEWSGGAKLFAWEPGGTMGSMSEVSVATFVGEAERDGQSGGTLSSGTIGGASMLVVGGARSDAQGVDQGAAWFVEMTQ